MKSSKAATENYGNKEVGVANHRTSTYGISKQPSSSNFFGGSALQASPGSQVSLVPPSTAAAASASPGLSAAGERLGGVKGAVMSIRRRIVQSTDVMDSWAPDVGTYR